MKTAIAAILAIGLLSGAAYAADPFTSLNDSAPRSVFTDLQASAPRSVFDDLQATAPRTVFETLQDTAPRSDGVFGTLQTNSP